MPAKLANDPQLGPYFSYLQKFLHDLWVRTGAGEDDIGGALQTAGGTMTGPINLSSTTLQVNSVQVITAQQAAIADASAATATNPAAPTDYTAPSSGASPVTSNDAGDFTAAAAALEILRDEVAAYETQISNLVVDVASIRTAVNSLLAAMRVHGLIDT